MAPASTANRTLTVGAPHCSQVEAHRRRQQLARDAIEISIGSEWEAQWTAQQEARQAVNLPSFARMVHEGFGASGPTLAQAASPGASPALASSPWPVPAATAAVGAFHLGGHSPSCASPPGGGVGGGGAGGGGAGGGGTVSLSKSSSGKTTPRHSNRSPDGSPALAPNATTPTLSGGGGGVGVATPPRAVCAAGSRAPGSSPSSTGPLLPAASAGVSAASAVAGTSMLEGGGSALATSRCPGRSIVGFAVGASSSPSAADIDAEPPPPPSLAEAWTSAAQANTAAVACDSGAGGARGKKKSHAPVTIISNSGGHRARS